MTATPGNDDLARWEVALGYAVMIAFGPLMFPREPVSLLGEVAWRQIGISLLGTFLWIAVGKLLFC